MYNKEKTFHCNAHGIFACYTDSNKHSFIRYPNTHSQSIQIYGNKYKGHSHQDYEDNRYTYLQNHLYQQCVYGIKVCTEAEVAKMSFKEKMLIQYNHKRTQQLINLSKWKANSDLVKDTLSRWFKTPKSNLQWFMNSTDDIQREDNADINKDSLRSIGGKERLIAKLIENNILPSNFYNLKSAA